MFVLSEGATVAEGGGGGAATAAAVLGSSPTADMGSWKRAFGSRTAEVRSLSFLRLTMAEWSEKRDAVSNLMDLQEMIPHVPGKVGMQLHGWKWREGPDGWVARGQIDVDPHSLPKVLRTE